MMKSDLDYWLGTNAKPDLPSLTSVLPIMKKMLELDPGLGMNRKYHYIQVFIPSKISSHLKSTPKLSQNEFYRKYVLGSPEYES